MRRTIPALALLSVLLNACGGTPSSAPAPAPEGAPASGPAANGAVGTPPSAPTAGQPLAPAATPPPAEPAAPPQPRTVEVTVPAGTRLSIELLTSLSTETAQEGAPVRGRLRRAVSVDDRLVLPEGAELEGSVTESVRPGRVKGRGALTFAFTRVVLRGESVALRTEPLTFVGEADRKGDAVKVGGGAAVGAIVGGLLGGGSGAAKGAAIGGAAGTGAMLATRGDDVAVEAGRALSTATTRALTVELPR